jgi:acyl carrier protein
MNKLLEIVFETVQEIGKDQDNTELLNPNEDTRLFSENLDSMGIVFLITDLESKISETFNLQIVLANERAMSQKTSPFRSVKTLTKYIQMLIDEETKAN